MAGVGCLLAGAIMYMVREPPPTTVSTVTRQIAEIALAGGRAGTPRGADAVGPWRLSASSIDSITGEYQNLRVASGDTIIASRRAKLHVDPVTDTFSFEMWDVTFLTAPSAESGEEGFVHQLDHHVLGPAPFNTDVVPDGGTAPTPIDGIPDSGLAEVDDYAVHPD